MEMTAALQPRKIITKPPKKRCAAVWQKMFDEGEKEEKLLHPRKITIKPPTKPRISVWWVWQTLFEVDSKYVPLKPVGRGAYGVVCSAINSETKEKVAIKKIPDAFENSSDALRTLREVSISRQIQHENVVALKDVAVPGERESFKDVYLVYELMDTDLDRILQSSQRLSAEHCQYLMFQLLQGLRHLHAANVLHRDLKPSNILLNSDSELKICDFGLARSCNDKGEFLTEYVVTRWYRAPELLFGCHTYGKPIDMWSAGCILAEILGRQPLFPGTDTLNQLKLIVGVLGSPKEADMEFVTDLKSRRHVESMPYFQGKSFEELFPDADALALDLLGKLLVFDPAGRITAEEALQHPYLLNLWDSSCNPPAPAPVHVVGDEGWLGEAARELMWVEMLRYHPERRWFQCPMLGVGL